MTSTAGHLQSIMYVQSLNIGTESNNRLYHCHHYFVVTALPSRNINSTLMNKNWA